jgi:hypothetical protein
MITVVDLTNVLEHNLSTVYLRGKMVQYLKRFICSRYAEEKHQDKPSAKMSVSNNSMRVYDGMMLFQVHSTWNGTVHCA